MDINNISKILFEKIEDIISDFVLDNSKISSGIKFDSNLRDELYLDELAFVELVIWLETEFDIEIFDDDIEQFIVVQDVLDYIHLKIEM